MGETAPGAWAQAQSMDARVAAATVGKRGGRRNVDAGGRGSVDIVSSARGPDIQAPRREDEKAHQQTDGVGPGVARQAKMPQLLAQSAVRPGVRRAAAGPRAKAASRAQAALMAGSQQP